MTAWCVPPEFLWQTYSLAKRWTLVMAMENPDVHIKAITVVAGNVPVVQGVQNALFTVELCQRSIPVHRGMPAPLTRPLETAKFVHGQDGMGDIGLRLTGRTLFAAKAGYATEPRIHIMQLHDTHYCR